MLTMESTIVAIFWAHGQVSLKHIPFWYPFLEAHVTTHYSNIGVRSRQITELDTSTLPPPCMPQWVWPQWTKYRMLFVQTFTPTPSMHHKLLGYGKYHMQNNHLPTKSLVESTDMRATFSERTSSFWKWKRQRLTIPRLHAHVSRWHCELWACRESLECGMGDLSY
jgi:hypothetical protein